MSYARTNGLVSRKGYASLGATGALSIPAVTTKVTYIYPSEGALATSAAPIAAGTKVTVTAVSSSGLRVQLAKAGGKTGWWADRSAVTEQKSTSENLFGKLVDFAKGAGGSLLSSGVTAGLNKATAAPPPTVYGPASSVGGISTKTLAIAGGGVVLLALLLRKKGA